MKGYREITPINKSDLFVILDSINKGFDYPVHNHPEYEITLVINSSGTRIVGDSTERYRHSDLVLLGPYLFHKWDDNSDETYLDDCRVITLQFDMHLFDSQLLSKAPLKQVRKVLDRSSRGIRFVGNTFERCARLMDELTSVTGIDSMLKFLKLLDVMAESNEYYFLASEGFDQRSLQSNNKRLHATYQYIIKHFCDPELKMSDVAAQINLSESAFSHFFKKCTNKSFTRFLLDMRLGYACKLLQETDDLIREVSMAAGFNNLANFNRLFKKYRHCTPKQYRRLFQEKLMFDWGEQHTPGQFIPADNTRHLDYRPAEYRTRLIHT